MFPLPPCAGSSAPAALQWASSSFNFEVGFFRGFVVAFWGSRELLWHTQLCSIEVLTAVPVSSENAWPEMGEGWSVLLSSSAGLWHCYITVTSCYNSKPLLLLNRGVLSIADFCPCAGFLVLLCHLKCSVDLTCIKSNAAKIHLVFSSKLDHFADTVYRKVARAGREG